MRKPETEEVTLEIEVAVPVKQPRHVAVAARHLIAQRERAIAARDKADDRVSRLYKVAEAKVMRIHDKADEEVNRINAALTAIGWKE